MRSLHWPNGYTPIEETGATRKDKGLSITGGTIALTEWAFCHEAIFELIFAQKYRASSHAGVNHS